MFSYLRSHRRTGSTPSSPHPSQWSGPSPLGDTYDSPAYSHFSEQGSNGSPAMESPVSPLPPTLPPIPRIASRGEQDRKRLPSPRREPAQKLEDKETPRLSIPQPPHSRPHTTSNSLLLPTIPRVASRYESDDKAQYYRETKSADGSQDPALRPTGFRKPLRPDARTLDVLSSSSNVDYDRETSKAPLHTLQQQGKDTAQRPTTPSGGVSQQDSLSVPTASHRPASPTSSFSSYQRTPSSTNVNTEYSPASSKSAHPPPAPQLAPQPKLPTKSKSKLLNPVASFLKKRKASHGSDNISEHDLVPRNTDIPAVGLPDNYDPRIRGKGVHDFSAPRERRIPPSTVVGQGPGPTITTQDEHNGKSVPVSSSNGLYDPSSTELDRERTPEREHAPVFVENFDDDGQEQDNSAVMRESLANPDFLKRMSRQLDFGAPDTYDGSDRSTPTAQQERNNKAVDNRTSSDQSTIRSSISNETKATSPPQSPPSRQSRVSLDPPFQPAGLPKHMKSSASSRFSFQMTNDPSAVEERALEEKHKQKSRAHRASLATQQNYLDSDEEDPSMYDDIDYDDYEERIPGVNVEDEEDFPGIESTQLLQGSIQQPAQPASGTPVSPSMQDSDAARSLIAGLGLVQIQDMGDSSDVSRQASEGPERSGTQYSGLSENMYFDDGMIDSPGDQENNEFDESVFDSPVNRDFHHQQGSQFSATLLDEVNRQSEDQPSSRSDYGDDTIEVKQPKPELGTTQQGSFDHLSAYHDALVSAANQAAADGKFYRQNSLSDYGDEVNGFGPQDWDDNSYPEDIDLEDDPMIAAANAEALAADDSGFYGQEFGFFGASRGKEGQFYNGGYFGDPLVQAGMVSREPNLTPITERSEFSTRNSFVSLGQFGLPGSSHGAPLSASAPREPGLKELAANMGMEDEDMTLSQLIKLRKETFGSSHSHSNSLGSNTSNHSSPNTNFVGPFSPRNSNPLAPTQEEDIDDQYNNSSSFGEESEFEDGYDSPNSPTVTMANAITMASPGRLSAGSSHEVHSSTTNYSNFSDYSESQNMSPQPGLASNQGFREYHKPQAFPHTSRDIVLPSNAGPMAPPPPKPSTSSSTNQLQSLPAAAPVSPPPILSNPAPMPSSSILSKLNTRPHAPAYSNFHRRAASHEEKSSTGSVERNRDRDSVTYVRGEESEGGGWYLERRRTMDTGEVVVVGRELVEGGRI